MDISQSFLTLIGLFLIIGSFPALAIVPEGVPSVNGTGCPDLHEGYLNDPSMKTIGMIGGIGWSSSAVYYQLLNEMVNQRMGGDFSATILLYSIDFETFSEQERLAMEGDWDVLRGTMVDAARRLRNGGADFIIICSNTMHSTSKDITRETGLPVVHIVDATGRKIQQMGLKRVGLLGTKYTMEQGFYTDILEKKYDLTVLTPDPQERDRINTIIFDELVNNKISDRSKAEFITFIRNLQKKGAEGIILGCTEIPLLIHQEDVEIPVFDTMTIHAEAAVDYALKSPDSQA